MRERRAKPWKGGARAAWREKRGGRGRNRRGRSLGRASGRGIVPVVRSRMDGHFASVHPFGRAALWLATPLQSCLFASPPRGGFALSRMKGVLARARRPRSPPPPARKLTAAFAVQL